MNINGVDPGRLALTRSMAAEWGAAGIQANSLAPGYIHTR